MKRLALAGAFLFAISAAFAKDSAFVYPKPQKSNQTDNYFGTKVADPYRGLENADSPATKKWIEAENKITYDYLATIPEREKINKRLTALWDYEKFGVPFHEADRYFFAKNTGLQNQSVIYKASSLPGDASVLIDPNTLVERWHDRAERIRGAG